MTALLSIAPVEAITSGAQLFRCVPYNCNMLARACVTRQSQADSAFPPAHLMLCKGCELGREVKRRALDVEVDPHDAYRTQHEKPKWGTPLDIALSHARASMREWERWGQPERAAEWRAFVQKLEALR